MIFSKNVILGNGRFPHHAIPVGVLRDAETIICCDGAADSLIEFGLVPTIIIGDMDSIQASTKQVFASKIVVDSNQENNDQTKAVEWAIKNGLTDVVIVGATGLREDHTIGNISLLAEYAKQINVSIISNYGVFKSVSQSTTFESYHGQKVSLFSLIPETKITSKGLKYSLNELPLRSWWKGTLNESTADSFHLEFENGTVIVFQVF